MSATTITSGFVGCGLRNFGSAGTPPYDNDARTVLRKSERAAVLALPALREPRGQRPRERVHRVLQGHHLLARRVHELDVLGQRLAQRARHCLDAAIGDEQTTDLVLDQLTELLEPRLELLARETIGQLALVDLAALLRLAHETRSQIVHVDLTQGAVQVVRATHRPARLHARVLLHRLRREATQLVDVHALQRGDQHGGQLLAAERLSPALPASTHLTVGGLTVLLAVEPCQRVGVGIDAVAEQREVDVEHGVERGPVPVVLHQRGRERGLELLTVVEIEVLDRAHGVEVLGHRHRQARGTQLMHEALEQVEQRRPER